MSIIIIPISKIVIEKKIEKKRVLEKLTIRLDTFEEKNNARTRYCKGSILSCSKIKDRDCC